MTFHDLTWVMPVIAVLGIVGNGAISWSAVQRLERNDTDREHRIRKLEVSVAVLKNKVGLDGGEGE